MLTPSFSIIQNEEYLFVNIHAPYTQLKDVEINVLGSVFWFYSSPYFLRLHFPCGIVDDDEPPASFNSDKGEFEVRLRKEQIGQHFPDLDLLATLLAPKRTQQKIKPSIEVVTENVEMDEEDDEDEDEWLFEQELPQTEPLDTTLQNIPKYGFANQTSGVFQQVKTEFKEIIDLPDPDSTPVSQREEMKTKEEKNKFCPDHYLADFMEPEVLQECLEYTAPWSKETPDNVKLTNEEKECLKKLGNKEFLLSKEDKAGAWLSLVDIIFAFAYNHRTTLGENNVESAWNINKLSATLSWFCNFTSLRSVVVSCFRRSLTYPLYRNWDLTNLVLKDTKSILKLGRRRVLKCLLEVHSLFASSEQRYLLNQLYISDYCIWLQRTSESKLAKLAETLDKITISKCDVGFELQHFEAAALQIQEEENLAYRMQNVKLQTSEQDLSSLSDHSTTSSSDIASHESEPYIPSERTSSTSEDIAPLDSDDDSSSDGET